MKKAQYEEHLNRLQIELVKLQSWLTKNDKKVVVVFEGRDAAGKGGVIKAIRANLNPRVCKVAALGVPSDVEKTQWYFQRYVAELPSAGQIVLFDRSWYNRAGVERVMGFCNDAQLEEFMQSCPEFEHMLSRSGIILLKYWFSVSPEEQENRFKERIENPLKQWKFSEMDFESRRRWSDYSVAKDEMFARTDTVHNPWFVVDADVKRIARLNCIQHILDSIPYTDVERKNIKLDKISPSDMPRPRKESFNYVSNIYGDSEKSKSDFSD